MVSSKNTNYNCSNSSTLSVLEQAAKLIDKSIARHLILLKLSCGMDSLSSVQKERSVAFANALNAIEGVHASETAQQNIDKWKAEMNHLFQFLNQH